MSLLGWGVIALVGIVVVGLLALVPAVKLLSAWLRTFKALASLIESAITVFGNSLLGGGGSRQTSNRDNPR